MTRRTQTSTATKVGKVARETLGLEALKPKQADNCDSGTAARIADSAQAAATT